MNSQFYGFLIINFNPICNLNSPFLHNLHHKFLRLEGGHLGEWAALFPLPHLEDPIYFPSMLGWGRQGIGCGNNWAYHQKLVFGATRRIPCHPKFGLEVRPPRLTTHSASESWLAPKSPQLDQPPSHPDSPHLAPNCTMSLHIFYFFFNLGFSCGMWDLVPWPGIKSRPSELESRSLNHWTTKEGPFHIFKNLYYCCSCKVNSAD